MVSILSLIVCFALTGCAGSEKGVGTKIDIGAETGAEAGAGIKTETSTEAGAGVKTETGAEAGADTKTVTGAGAETTTYTNSGNDAIGIIGAMEPEVRTLKEAANIQKTTTVAGMDFCEGKLGDKDVVIVQCGIGKVNAGVCANTLINDFGCTKIINTGVAGSLDNNIDIGDIVVSTDTVQHDFDVEAIGFARGEIPYTGLYAFPADENLRAAAVRAVSEAAPEISVFEGRVCSGDQFISTKEQKDTIINNFGGMCCEMEGAAIGQVCYLNETPFVVIRAISDKPDETEIVEYKEFEKTAAEHCAKIVQHMIEGM